MSRGEKVLQTGAEEVRTGIAGISKGSPGVNRGVEAYSFSLRGRQREKGTAELLLSMTVQGDDTQAREEETAEALLSMAVHGDDIQAREEETAKGLLSIAEARVTREQGIHMDEDLMKQVQTLKNENTEFWKQLGAGTFSPKSCWARRSRKGNVWSAFCGLCRNVGVP